MRHQYNLAAKESGLERKCMNNDDFTVLVSGGGRHHWMSMRTMWPSLDIPPLKVFGWFRRSQLWASGDWQFHHHNTPARASHHMQFFCETSSHPGDSATLQPRFGAMWLLAFPKTKITFEREEISDHQWDSGKYSRTTDGDGRTVWGPKVPTLKGTEALLSYVQCFLYLVSSSINVSIFLSTWMDTFWTDLLYMVFGF